MGDIGESCFPRRIEKRDDFSIGCLLADVVGELVCDDFPVSCCEPMTVELDAERDADGIVGDADAGWGLVIKGDVFERDWPRVTVMISKACSCWGDIEAGRCGRLSGEVVEGDGNQDADEKYDS